MQAIEKDEVQQRSKTAALLTAVASANKPPPTDRSVTPREPAEQLETKRTQKAGSPRASSGENVVLPSPSMATGHCKESHKLYKKSLENYYFEYNSHPMKTVREEREQNKWRQMSMSSTQIMREQMSCRHWTSDFNSNIGNVEAHLREMFRVKTPLENLTPKEDLHKLSATTLRLGTGYSYSKKPRTSFVS